MTAFSFTQSAGLYWSWRHERKRIYGLQMGLLCAPYKTSAGQLNPDPPLRRRYFGTVNSVLYIFFVRFLFSILLHALSICLSWLYVRLSLESARVWLEDCSSICCENFESFIPRVEYVYSFFLSFVKPNSKNMIWFPEAAYVLVVAHPDS